MDPVTGIIGLTALGAASLLSMKLKREGFTVLPGGSGDGYPTSVEESQTRYNKFSGMINPLVNAVIPVGSDQATVDKQRQLVNQALGNTEAVFSKDKVQTLALKEMTNKNIPRAEGDRSLFGAMQFCRAAVEKSDRPFSIRDPETNKVTKPSEKSANGIWDFDEVCGVCLTRGVDEEGKPFEKARGMIIDPNAKQTAYEERARKGYPYPRIAPALATCEGAPNMPVFAANDIDLVRYQRRLKCQHTTAVGGPDNCAICYEYDSRSYVPLKDDPKNGVVAVREQTINLNLQGVGNATILLNNKQIGKVTLSKEKAEAIPLTDAIEGQTFNISVTSTTTKSLPQLYGYIESATPNGGVFRMPLNLIMTSDVANNRLPPNRAYGFHSYKDFGFLCAIMGPASGKTLMNLQGLVPFTFVQPDEFAAIDCPSAPFQASADTIRDYAKDQPCFTKDSKPGQYSTACLQEVIINAGCTNQGTLYNKPEMLNGTKAKPNDLFAIYSILADLKDNDMVDEEKTMMCSGRRLARPCDPFMARTDLKFMPLLMSTEAKDVKMKTNATQCLSQIYNNQGANESNPNEGLGPTYSGLVTYKNNQRERKNIYCLPDGKLNPDNSDDALMTLAKIADEGYANMYSIQAVKKFLNDQLELAADWRYNANKDSGRKTAIANCFGKDLAEIPQLASQEPTMMEDVCGVMAQYVRIRAKGGVGIGVSQIVIVDKNGNNIAPGADTSLSSPPLNVDSPASAAVDGILAVRSGTLPKYLSRDNISDAQFVVNLGLPRDVTKVTYYGVDMGNYLANKGQLVLELLDESQKVLASKDCTTSKVDSFDFLSPDADPTSCKTALIMKTISPNTPTGFADGLYGRMYVITNATPGPVFGSSGWGDRIGDVGAYTSLASPFSSGGSSGTAQIVAGPMSGKPYAFFMKGYYMVNEPQILYLQVESTSGAFITLNNIVVLNNWNASKPRTILVSNPIYLQQKGLYPIQISFYNDIKYSQDNNFGFNYKINEETEWKSSFKGAFAYNINEENLLDEQWAQELRRREEERKAAEAAAALAARNAKIADFQTQMTTVKNTVAALYQEGTGIYTEALKFSQNLDVTGVTNMITKLKDTVSRMQVAVGQADSIYASIMSYDKTLNTTFDPILADIKANLSGTQGLQTLLQNTNTLVSTTQAALAEALRKQKEELISSRGFKPGIVGNVFYMTPGDAIPKIPPPQSILNATGESGGWSLRRSKLVYFEKLQYQGPGYGGGISDFTNTYSAGYALYLRGYYFADEPEELTFNAQARAVAIIFNDNVILDTITNQTSSTMNYSQKAVMPKMGEYKFEFIFWAPYQSNYEYAFRGLYWKKKNDRDYMNNDFKQNFYYDSIKESQLDKEFDENIFKIPAGMTRGLYQRSYKVADTSILDNFNADTFIRGNPSGTGWTPEEYESPTILKDIKFQVDSNPYRYKNSSIGYIATGYYIANTPHRLQLQFNANGFYYIKFNGNIVIRKNRWFGWYYRLDGSETSSLNYREGVTLDISQPGRYPIEIVWEKTSDSYATFSWKNLSTGYGSSYIPYAWTNSAGNGPPFNNWSGTDSMLKAFAFDPAEQQTINSESAANIEKMNAKINNLISQGLVYRNTWGGTSYYFLIYKNKNYAGSCFKYLSSTNKPIEEDANSAFQEIMNNYSSYSDMGFSIQRRLPDYGGQTWMSLCIFNTSQDYGFRSDINAYHDFYIPTSLSTILEKF